MEEAWERMPAWLNFVNLQLVTGIVALNTLIAIMGDSFDDVYSNYDKFDCKTKVELLLELNDIYFWNRSQAGKWMYMFVI